MSRTADQPHRRSEAAEGEQTHRRWLGLALAAAVAAAMGTAMVTIPREHAPLAAVARYVMEVALAKWKLTEPVNEIVYGTRGFDTFGETFLLLAAVVSVVVMTRSREPRRGYFGESQAGEHEQAEADPPDRPDAGERAAKVAERQEEETGESSDPSQSATPDAEPLGTPAPERAEAMTVVIRTAIRVALPILAVAGCYLVAEGFSPGGGFPAGAVLLGVALLAYVGFGRRRVSKVVKRELLETIEMAGAMMIILTELLGLLLKGSFSANWLPLATVATILSGGVAQLFSGSELIEVGTGLGIAVFAMIGMGHDWARDTGHGKDGEDGGGEQR